MKKISAFLLLLFCVLHAGSAIAQKYDSDGLTSGGALVSSFGLSRALMTADASSLPAPNDFVIPLGKVTRNSVWVSWNGASATSDHSHKVYYYNKWEEVKDVSAGVHEATIDNLEAGKRYSFSGSNIKNGTESARSEELIVDLTPDTSPPNVPTGLKLALSQPGKLKVSFKSNNRNMIDLKGFKVYYGSASNTYSNSVSTDAPADISADISVDISIQEGVSYYVAASAYDLNSNESQKTPEVAYSIQESEEDGEDKKGCFIATAAFGSRDHPVVKIFREFRDKILLNYFWGKQVVESYYRHSPKASKIIQDSAVLKIAVIILLSPALIFCYSALAVGILWTSTLSVFLISSIIMWKWLLLKK